MLFEVVLNMTGTSPMSSLATHLMNVGYIRKRIKEFYPKIVMYNCKKNNFVIIPSHYEDKKQQQEGVH